MELVNEPLDFGSRHLPSVVHRAGDFLFHAFTEIINMLYFGTVFFHTYDLPKMLHSLLLLLIHNFHGKEDQRPGNAFVADPAGIEECSTFPDLLNIQLNLEILENLIVSENASQQFS